MNMEGSVTASATTIDSSPKTVWRMIANESSNPSRSLSVDEAVASAEADNSKTLSKVAVTQPVSVLATPIRNGDKILDSRTCLRINLHRKTAAFDAGQDDPLTSLKPLLPAMSVLQPDVRRKLGVPNVTLDSNSRLPLAVTCDKSSFVKPECSYNCLIGMALFAHGRLPVAGIYSYIQYHFPYFRTSAPEGWKNSVRHSLSLGTYFRKAVPLPKLQKGNCWEVAPQSKERLQREIVCFINVAQRSNSLNLELPALRDLHIVERQILPKQDCRDPLKAGTSGEESLPGQSPQPLSVCTGSPPATTKVNPRKALQLSVPSTAQQTLEERHQQLQITPSQEQTKDEHSPLLTSTEFLEISALLDSFIHLSPQQERRSCSEHRIAPSVAAKAGLPEASSHQDEVVVKQQSQRAIPVVIREVEHPQPTPVPKEEEPMTPVDRMPENLAAVVRQLPPLHKQEMGGAKNSDKKALLPEQNPVAQMPQKFLLAQTLQGQRRQEPSFQGIEGAPTLATTAIQPTPCVQQLPTALAMPQLLPQARVPSLNGGLVAASSQAHIPSVIPDQTDPKGKSTKRQVRKVRKQSQTRKIPPSFPPMAYAYNMPNHRFMPYPPAQMWGAYHVPQPQPLIYYQGSYYQPPGAWQQPHASLGQYFMGQAQGNTLPTNQGDKEGGPSSDDLRNQTYLQQLQEAWHVAQYSQLAGTQHLLPRSHYQGLYTYPPQGYHQTMNQCANLPPLTGINQTAAVTPMSIPVLSTTCRPATQSYWNNEDEDLSGNEAETKPTRRKKPRLQQKQKRKKGKAKDAESKRRKINTAGLTKDSVNIEQQHDTAETPPEGPQHTPPCEASGHNEHNEVKEPPRSDPPVCTEDTPTVRIIPDGLELDVNQLIQALDETEHYLKVQMHNATQLKQDTSTTVPMSNESTSTHWSHTSMVISHEGDSNSLLSEVVSSEGLTIDSQADPEEQDGGDIQVGGTVGEWGLGVPLAGVAMANIETLPLLSAAGREVTTHSPADPPSHPMHGYRERPFQKMAQQQPPGLTGEAKSQFL